MLPDEIQGILLDVEGTTTPISFVYETLFPYARERLESTCAAAPALSGVSAAVERLRAEYDEERSTAPEHLPEFGDGAAYAAYLMRQDRKSTGLKLLQGIIWEEGYLSGELRSVVFDDVAPAFEAWRQDGRRLRIFSSGSVLAQKLLFGHTDHGDLCGMIEGYHDTTTGPKRRADAYRAIAGEFDLVASSILFLSDVVEELDAARAAGMRTGLLSRPGNHPVPAHDHPVHETFLPLFP